MKIISHYQQGAYMSKILLSISLLAAFVQSDASLAADVSHIPIGDKVEATNGQGVNDALVPKINVTAMSFKNKLALEAVSSKYIDAKPSQTRAIRGAKEASIYEEISPSVVLIVTDEAIGSGSVITRAGAVLTNYHVVKGHEYVAVVFKPKDDQGISKKDFYRAKVIRYDEVKDLALVKLVAPPKNLKAIKLGMKGPIKVGHDVHAIGHPTGEYWTYTKGFISQLRDEYQWVTEMGVKHQAYVIQTQTPINPGNSGGPLINNSGELIGVNSFKAPGEALNFAVHISAVNTFLKGKGNVDAEVVEKECEFEVDSSERNDSNDSTYYYYDFDCNGTVESRLEEPDSIDKPIILLSDGFGDGKYDEAYFDYGQDGKWDESYYDTTNDGHVDLKGFHPDGEIEASRYEKYSS
jgi:hypothetical protein